MTWSMSYSQELCFIHCDTNFVLGTEFTEILHGKTHVDHVVPCRGQLHIAASLRPPTWSGAEWGDVKSQRTWYEVLNPSRHG